MRVPRVHLILLACTGVWCLAILAAPVAQISAVYTFFSVICHQDPSRSLHVMGAPLPVCIRCMSIYFGFFVGLVTRVPVRPDWLRWAVALTVIEFVLAWFLFDSSIIRSATGLLLGAVAAPFVVAGLKPLEKATSEPV